MSFEISSGNLQLVSTPLILRKVWDQKETGMLTFKRDNHEKSLFFKDGKTIAAISDLPEEQLDSLMYQGGVIEQDTYDQLVMLVRETGWRSPQVEEIVDVQTQKWWTRTVLREVFLSLMEWQYGEYQFFPRKTPPTTQVTVEMDTDRLLTSILRRIQDLDILVSILGGQDAVLKINQSGFTGEAARSLTAEDGFFLSRIDGQLTLKNILSMGGAQKLDMSRCYITAMLNGLIILPEKKQEINTLEEEIESIPETVDEAVVEAEADEGVNQEIDEEEDIPVIKDDSQDIMLTTDELKDLQKLAGKLDSDFLDLSKSIDLNAPKQKDELGYDVKISYQRGDEFVESDGADGAYDVDQLGRITSQDEMSGDALGDRITLIIDGKSVDGESDVLGAGLSKEIFEAEDEEKQWNLWMVSEEELNTDFEMDWSSTWSDWVENTQELTKLRDRSSELETKYKSVKDTKLREEILRELKKHNADLQLMIAQKKRQIFAMHRRMQLMNYYELLRIKRDATLERIESAYDEWEKEISPDESELKEFLSIAPQINQIIELLEEAYNVLRNPEKRAEYDEKLIKQEAATEAMKEKKALLAEDHMMSARTAMRRGDQMLAMRFLRGSMSLDSSNSVYFREMGKILAANENWRKEALRFYHRAFHLDPENYDVLLDVASLAIELKLMGFARKSLLHILQEKPTHVKAKRLLNKIKAKN